MAEALTIAVLLGSLRKGSYNAALMRALPAIAPEDMTFTQLPRIDTLPIYDGDIEAQGFPQAVLDMAAQIKAADGVLIVTPEYNHSIPGGLKNAIDWLSRLKDQPFSGKAVALQSASQGITGGARAQQDLRPIMAFMNAFVLNKPEILVGRVQDKVDAQGELADESTRQFMGKQLVALADLIRKLR